MVITGLAKEKIEELEYVLRHWKGYYYIDKSMFDGMFDVTIELRVPVILKYFGGDGATGAYISLWCGDNVFLLTHSDYISIEL